LDGTPVGTYTGKRTHLEDAVERVSTYDQIAKLFTPERVREMWVKDENGFREDVMAANINISHANHTIVLNDVYQRNPEKWASFIKKEADLHDELIRLTEEAKEDRAAVIPFLNEMVNRTRVMVIVGRPGMNPTEIHFGFCYWTKKAKSITLHTVKSTFTVTRRYDAGTRHHGKMQALMAEDRKYTANFFEDTGKAGIIVIMLNEIACIKTVYTHEFTHYYPRTNLVESASTPKASANPPWDRM